MELRAGMVLIVDKEYSSKSKGSILYAVSDIELRHIFDFSSEYFCIDILDPMLNDVKTWRRRGKEELVSDIEHFHTLIDNV